MPARLESANDKLRETINNKNVMYAQTNVK